MKSSLSSLRDFFENLNYATFILAGLGSLLALWLNNQYVSQEVYEKDQEIIALKIESLETETQALRFMAQANQNDIRRLLPLVEKIEKLVSNFITPDGKVLITENMQKMELDIAEIKNDIEEMKDRLWPSDRN